MSYKFSKRSLDNLATCHADLQRIAHEAIKVIDFTVICGHRGKDAQNEAFNTRVSKLKWPESKHNSTPSLAMDCVPYPLDWKDTESFVFLAGVFYTIAKQLNIPIRQGVDWNGNNKMTDEKFRDYPHIELV